MLPARLGAKNLQLDRYSDQIWFELWNQFSPVRIAELNCFDFLAGSLFFIVLGTLVIHVALWPTMEKPIYLLQEIGVVKRRKLAGIVGLACIVYATGSSHELLKSVLDVF